MSAAYPTAPQLFPTNRLRAPSGSTAETMILVALILQIIGAVVLLIGITWLLGFSILNPYPYAWVAVSAAVGVGVVAVVFLYFAYTLCFERTQRGEYQEAKDPTLVIGILSLIFGILPGIFYIIAFVKLGDAVREQQALLHPQMAWPAMYPPAAPMACIGCGRVYPTGQFAFCPGCGRKLGA